MPRVDKFLRKEGIKNKKRQGTRIFHIPASVKTVDDLLAHDDVNALLGELADNKANITDMLILYKDADGTIHWHGTPESKLSTIVYMLECAKFGIMTDDED